MNTPQSPGKFSIEVLRSLNALELAGLLQGTLHTYCEQRQPAERETLLRLIEALKVGHQAAENLRAADAALDAYLRAEERNPAGEPSPAIDPEVRATAYRARERHLATKPTSST